MSLTSLDRVNSADDLVPILSGALGTSLGTYNYKQGATTGTQPSIYVIKNPDTDPPREWKRKGIEVLIYQPKIVPRDYISGTGLNNIFDIKLIQHDRSKKLNQAKSALLTQLPLLQERSHLYADRNLQEEVNLYYCNQTIG